VPVAPAIEVTDVHRTFVVRRRAGRLRRRRHEVRAVDGLSFTVGRGEMVGLLGPNGAGKSTTVKMLTGILVPTSGTLRVAGLEPSRARTTLARRIGVVFGQRSGLWWDLPLRDSFALLRRIYDVPPERHAVALAEFVEMLDLGELLDTPVRALSLGQRMRGEIAAALLHEPELLYLDEPTIGLDVVSKGRLRGFLRRVNTEKGTTVVLTTHDLGDVEQLCRRVLVVDHGRLVFDGSLDELRRLDGSPRTVVVDLADTAAPVEVDGAIVTRVDGPRQWLALPSGGSAAGVIARLITAYDVVDLSIADPEIEDVIARLYSRG
jgi:ABC-2 type transport system ATP-binding protein